MSDRRPRSLELAVFLCGALAMAGGCKVGPDWRGPDVATPAGWSGVDASSVGPDATSRPVPAPADVAAWWDHFNDPLLTSLVQRAASGNLALAQAGARVCQARAARVAAASGLFPQIGASGSALRSRAGGGGSSTQNFYQAGFDASWEIDVFGGTRRGVEAAEADLRSAMFDRENILVSVAGEVGTAYLQLRGSQRQLSIARQNLAAQQQTLDLTQERLDAGFVSALDVANARAQVATTASQIPAFEADVRADIYALSVLIGGSPDALLSELLPEAPFPSPPGEVPVGLPSEILTRRPDLRRAEADLHAATARVGVAVADQYPKFSLTGAIGTQSGEIGSLTSLANRFWSIGPSFTLPVFTGGLLQANVEQAKAITCQALFQYKGAVLAALQEVETALVRFTGEQDRRARLVESVAANRDAVSLSLQQYSAGKTDFLNVLTAQRLLYATEAALAESETTIGTNLVALYKALGGGWPESLPCR